jgi:hypothetical protein
MDPRRRDGLLAAGCLAGVLALLARRDGLATLRDPRAAAAGVTAALVVEWGFLRYPDRLLALWERPAVNRGSALGLLVAGVVARRRPRLLAAGAWGILTYILLLGRLLRSEEAGT